MLYNKHFILLNGFQNILCRNIFTDLEYDCPSLSQYSNCEIHNRIKLGNKFGHFIFIYI
jgi:hypothetical protein